MSLDCTRRTLVASLAASFVAGSSGYATVSTRRGTRPNRLDAPIVEGPLGARLHDYLSRAASFGFWGSVFVAIDDRPVLHQGFGYADLERRKLNTTRTLFDYGSTVKTMTGAAILLLASEGKLSITDRIGRWFDDVPPDKEDIRLEHLLTHSSGILDPPLSDYAPVSRDQLVAIVLASALGDRPGVAYNYSNAGFSMLAAIVERVTNSPYERFMRERLFLPAEMTTTGYTLPDWDPRLVAHTYTYPVDHGTPLERLRAANGPGWILMGNGGMIGTVADLHRWERFFRSGSVIPASQMANATTPHFWRSPRRGVGYDWEIDISESGERSYGHGSDAPYVGLSGWVGYFPAQRASIALVANNRLNGASTRHFALANIRRIIADEQVALPPVMPTIAAHDLRRAEGIFVSARSMIGVRAANGYLEVGANGQEAVDWFNSRQGETAVTEGRALNERANLFVRALSQPNPAALADIFATPADAESFLGSWGEALATRGQYRDATVLGTFRLDRRAFVTTVNFVFANGPVIARFAWQQGTIVASSEDLFLPSLAGPLRISPVDHAAWQPFWYPAERSLFTFDLATGATRILNASRRDGGIVELTLERPGGAVSRWVRQQQS